MISRSLNFGGGSCADRLQEFSRADVNKDGVVSEEEFSVELKDRQGKSIDLNLVSMSS